MLEIEDREYLKALMIHAVVWTGSPYQTVKALLPSSVGQNIAEGLPPAVLIESTLALAERDAWRTDPSTLANLLKGLLGDQGRVPKILARISKPAPPAADPFTSMMLDSRLPFLDRAPTRTVLRSWLKPMPVRQVMVVEGRRLTGKSHTNEFVRHVVRSVAATMPILRTALVAFDRDQAPSIGQLEVAAELMSAMGGDPATAPPLDTNTAAWTKQLVRWVLAEANRRDLHWWFVLDGFRSSQPAEDPGWRMREDARDFIATFTKGITNGINAERHRLLLLDFDRASLTLPPGVVGVDRTGAISRAVASSLVQELITASGRSLDAARLEADVLSGLPDPIDDLPELAARLMDLMEVA